MIPLGVLASRRPAASGAVTLNYAHEQRIESVTNSYSFTSVPIGSAGANRTVVVIASAGHSVGRSLTSATIGGVTPATDLARAATGHDVYILRANVPTGDTATVALTWTSALFNCSIGVWVSPTALAVEDADLGTTSVSLDAASSGSRVVALSRRSASEPTWDGGTQRYAHTLNSTNAYGADATVGGDGHTVSAPGSTALLAVAYGLPT